MRMCFSEDLVFDFSLEAEQSRHDIRALNIDYKLDPPLEVPHEYVCRSSPRSEIGHVPFSLV